MMRKVILQNRVEKWGTPSAAGANAIRYRPMPKRHRLGKFPRIDKGRPALRFASTFWCRSQFGCSGKTGPKALANIWPGLAPPNARGEYSRCLGAVEGGAP